MLVDLELKAGKPGFAQQVSRRLARFDAGRQQGLDALHVGPAQRLVEPLFRTVERQVQGAEDEVDGLLPRFQRTVPVEDTGAFEAPLSPVHEFPDG